MALNFPNTPSGGDIYTEGAVSYQYDAAYGVWRIVKTVTTANGQILYVKDGVYNGANGFEYNVLTQTVTANANVSFYGRVFANGALGQNQQVLFANATGHMYWGSIISEAANLAYAQANTSRNHANAAFLQANTARTHANAAHLTANAAFDKANLSVPVIIKNEGEIITNTVYSIDFVGTGVTATATGNDVTVSISGGGGGGGGALSWTYVGTNYTASAGEALFANTLPGSFVITLPATPNTSDTIYVADPNGNWSSNTLNIARNGKTIMGLNEDLTCDVANQSITLVYSGLTWRLV